MLDIKSPVGSIHNFDFLKKSPTKRIKEEINDIL